MMSAFRSCPQRFHNEFILGLSESTTSVHLHAGGALASALEFARKAFYSGQLSEELSVLRGLEKLWQFYGNFEPNSPRITKTWDRLSIAYLDYFETYPLSTDSLQPFMRSDGNPAVEFSFSLPMTTRHPSGDPFIFCGRIDALGYFAGGFAICDEKTTTSIGFSWAEKWGLRSQFLGYCYAMKQAGYDIQNILVRGIGILKTQIHQVQTIIPVKAFLVERWRAQFERDLQRMVKCFNDNIWDINLDDACNDYGGCAFRTLCESHEPEVWLDTYKKRQWDPIAIDPTHTAETLIRSLLPQ